MKPHPAIIAALPREISALVKGWHVQKLPNHIVVYTNGDAVVACAGMGPARAALAVEAALAAASAATPITALISAGLAGACTPDLHVGDIVRAGIVIDTQTGERYPNPQFQQILVTAPAIASMQEKRRLHDTYSAAAVDMEAAAVARLARAHNLEFSATKAISDEVDFELDGLSRFATPDGRFREAAFALHTLLHPPQWSKAMALARNSNKALTSLTAALQTDLDWYRKKPD
jgi:adenosylhomocysteine nucleosidase